MKRSPLCSVMAMLSLALPSSAAIVATNPDGTNNAFGRTGGIAVNFASGTPSGATSGLVNGLSYALDSLTLLNNGSTDNVDYYLGVYSGFSGAASPTGFISASNNSVNLSTSADGAIVWNFSGVTINASNPGTTLYFVLQDSNTQISSFDSSTFVEGGTKFERIDGNPSDGLGDYLNAVIHGNAGQGVYNSRPLEFSASLTAVPEPSTALLGGLGLVSLLLRRR